MNLHSMNDGPAEGSSSAPHPIYLDHNGSTPVTPVVLNAMRNYMEGYWGNAGASHPDGQAAKAAVERAAGVVARCLGVEADEVVFTSGGTESNNAIVFGVAEAARGTERQHIICGRHEHPSVLRPVEKLERDGHPVTWLNPARCGRVLPEMVAEALRPDTLLVCLMFANNETGILQPVDEVTRVAHAGGALMFVDGVCGSGKVPVRADEIGCDLLSLSGHKLHAPKGIGAFFVRRGTPMGPLIHGCGQQGGRRSGTENTAGAVALAAAMEAFEESLDQKEEGSPQAVRRLRDSLWQGLQHLDPSPGSVVRNGDGDDLPGTLSVWFPGRDALALQQQLGEYGLSVSAQAGRLPDGSTRPSHVLKSMGASDECASQSLRMSLGSTSTEADVRGALDAFQRVWSVSHASAHVHP